MANIIWTPPDGWVEENGAHVSFKAPCDCSVAGNLVIGSNSYSIVDAIGETLTGASGVFVSGAVLDFILDCENSKAYLQNSATSGLSGTWTPGFTNGGPSVSASNGVWYKIGKLVFVKGYIETSGHTTTESVAAVDGLPFVASEEAVLQVGYGNLQIFSTADRNDYMNAYAGLYVISGSSYAQIRGEKFGRIYNQNWATLGTGGIAFSGVYLTNE